MFIPSATNLGFAGGCNIGIDIALADPQCAYVWLLNNDTIVRRDSLSALVARFARGDDVGMCGSTLVYDDPAATVQACGGRFSMLLGRGTPIGAFGRLDDLPAVDAVERSLDYIVGASMLVSRRFLDQVGRMDERYFLYFEELDWALRGRAKGFRLGWAPQSVVVHKEGAAIGSAQRGRPSDLALYFMTASYLRLVAARRALLLPVALLRTLVNMAKWLARGDSRAAQVVARALGGFLASPRRSPGIGEARR